MTTLSRISVLAVLAVCSRAAPAQAPRGGAAARQVTIEFENDTVQVVRIRIGPHEMVPIHDVTPRVIVYLTDEHFRFTLPNGQTVDQKPQGW